MESFCVIGLGNFGMNLALTLAKNRHQVLAIDINQDVIDEIGEKVTSAVCGDATNDAVLRAAGVKSYDCCIVCLKESMQDSILATVILKELGIKRIVARATSERHKKVLMKVGAELVVFPEKDMGLKLAYTLSKRDVLDYFTLSDDFSIAEIMTPKSWVGKTILELDVRKKYGVNIIAISSGSDDDFKLLSDLSKPFGPDERIVIAGENKDMRRLTGK